MAQYRIVLSAELLGMIFQYLPFSDIENFIESAYDEPREDKYTANLTECLGEFKHRIDPTKYLNKYFKNARSLLFNMVEAGCVLTASRALEHIVPGVVHENSDWNFFVAPGLENIAYIMQCLEKQGVVWSNKIERLEYMLQFNPHIKDTEAYMARSKTDIDVNLDNLEYVAINHCNILAGTRSIFGYLLYKNKEVMVNLTYSTKDETPMQLIKRMDHSAIQCFISKIGIGHFYYTSACRNETYLWTNHWSLGTIRNLYEDSRYNIVRYDDFESAPNCIIRSLSDDTAKYINYANFGDKRIESICWYQFPNFLVHYDSPYEALAKDGKSQYNPKALLYQRLDSRIKNIRQHIENYIIMTSISSLPFEYKSPMYI